MSPTKIPDEKREKHWAAMLALLSNPNVDPNRATEISALAWKNLQSHCDFLAAKERQENFIPADDAEDEDDGA
jgi:hypothetical protein